jgi:predicted ATPase
MIAGDVANTAARLQTAAPTNAILVGDDTHRCTSGAIDYEPQAPLTLKGKEQPVVAWLARRALRQPGERSATGVPMIGRGPEFEQVRSAWQRTVKERRPQRVTILGLPGVGKSRLLTEFRAAVGDADARVLVGRALPYGESSAYGAFAQQVRKLAGILGDDAPQNAVDKLRAAVEDLLGDATEVTGHVASMVGLSTGVAEARDRRALFDSAIKLMEALAGHQPVVLVFEDLHWADSSLLDLIETLVAEVDGVPLMVISAARPELVARRPGWGARGAVALEPLGAEDARELAACLLAGSAKKEPSWRAAEFGEVGEGNPLFIEELIACAAERSSPGARELPTSIRGIIAARLDAIAAAERATLLAASVMGMVFWDGALARVTPSPEDLPGLLEALEQRDLVRRDLSSRFRGHRQYRFKHALIRDVAYAALPRAKRREGHASAAAFLEAMHTEGEAPAALGYHWLEAADPERATGHLIAAGDQASRGWAKEEAVALYRQATTLLPEDDLPRRRMLRLKLAMAQQMVYHVTDVEHMTRRQAETTEQE